MTDWKFERAAQAHRDRQERAYLASLEPHHYCKECDSGLGPDSVDLCDDFLREAQEEAEMLEVEHA